MMKWPTLISLVGIAAHNRMETYDIALTLYPR